MLITLESIFNGLLPGMIFSAVYIAVTLAITYKKWLPDLIK
jgi:hypothetical protein